jgi:hypothetical protein
MSVNNDALIKFEMEALKADIITVYNASGKRTSGEGFRTKLWTKCSYTIWLCISSW